MEFTGRMEIRDTCVPRARQRRSKKGGRGKERTKEEERCDVVPYGSVVLDGRTVSEMPWKILKVPRQYASHLSWVHFISSFYSISIFCSNVVTSHATSHTPRGDTTRPVAHRSPIGSYYIAERRFLIRPSLSTLFSRTRNSWKPGKAWKPGSGRICTRITRQARGKPCFLPETEKRTQRSYRKERQKGYRFVDISIGRHERQKALVAAAYARGY